MIGSSYWYFWMMVSLILAGFNAWVDNDMWAWCSIGLAFYYRIKFKTELNREKMEKLILELENEINKKDNDTENSDIE